MSEYPPPTFAELLNSIHIEDASKDRACVEIVGGVIHTRYDATIMTYEIKVLRCLLSDSFIHTNGI